MLLLAAFAGQHDGHGLKGDAEVEEEAGVLDVAEDRTFDAASGWQYTRDGFESAALLPASGCRHFTAS
jgi:hypothetical protein